MLDIELFANDLKIFLYLTNQVLLWSVESYRLNIASITVIQFSQV